MNTNDLFLWVEKFRPKFIDDCVLPKELKDTFKAIIKQGEIPNLILSGPPGCGKTTVAKALCSELGADILFINGSDESGIDVLRTKIRIFASSKSFTGAKKVVLLDEADYLNPQSTQPALRAFIEEFSENCSFILTCNFKNKIIEPLHSRCSVINFTISQGERKTIAKEMFLRLTKILKQENVEYDEKVLSQVLLKYFPDFRRLLGELQRFANTHGSITEGILSMNTSLDVPGLFKVLKSKNYPELRTWVVENMGNDSHTLYRQIYDACWKHLKPDSVPQMVLLQADYQYKSAFSVDPEVCLLAFLTEILASCEFKDSL